MLTSDPVFLLVESGPFQVGFHRPQITSSCIHGSVVIDRAQLHHPRTRPHPHTCSTGLPHRHSLLIRDEPFSPFVVYLSDLQSPRLASSPVSAISPSVRSPPHTEQFNLAYRIWGIESVPHHLPLSSPIFDPPVASLFYILPQPCYSFTSCSTRVSWPRSIDTPFVEV